MDPKYEDAGEATPELGQSVFCFLIALIISIRVGTSSFFFLLKGWNRKLKTTVIGNCMHHSFSKCPYYKS